VLSVEDYPQYDAENDGLLAYEEEAEQEVEIEINEDEAGGSLRTSARPTLNLTLLRASVLV